MLPVVRNIKICFITFLDGINKNHYSLQTTIINTKHTMHECFYEMIQLKNRFCS